MLEFLKLFFFAKLILLTPNPIDIEDNKVVQLQEPISALNSQGHIQIDVTSMMPSVSEVEVSRKFELLSERFPQNSISVRLLNTSTGDSVELSKISYAANSEQYLVYIISESGLATELEFDEVQIQSSISLRRVTLYWRNALK